MKTKSLTFAILAFLFATQIQAQDRTTVTANSTDISDNLDLKAVASIFGDSEDLADFERRLNDPKIQISNLDLNGDNQVDYLRVIETVENNTHLIIVQSVLERDVYQDVATIEVERDGNNNVQVQVVGDVYMYGSNYIYEPVYVNSPIIFNVFWTNHYRPYYSPWYWSYYPTYYSPWNPYPIYRYHRHVHNHINIHNHYNYVNTRRSSRAVAMYNTRRSNGYERQNPNRSFSQRNNNVSNRHELVQTRTSRTQNAGGTRNSGLSRNTTESRNSSPTTTTRNGSNTTRTNGTRGSNNGSLNTATTTRTATPTRSENNMTRVNTTRTSTPRTEAPSRVESTRNVPTTRTEAPTRVETSTRSVPATRTEAPTRVNTTRTEAPVRNSAPTMNRSTPEPRQSAPQPSRGNDGGGSRGGNSGSRGSGSRG